MIQLDSIKFGDGAYTLALPLKWIVECERACGQRDSEGVLRPKSIYLIHSELEAGLAQDKEGNTHYLGGGIARPSDIREVLRCALIGGGIGMVSDAEIKVGPHKAVELVDTYLPNPAVGWLEGHHLAWAVLDATIRGPKKKVTDDIQAEDQKPSIEASFSPTADNSGSTGTG